MNYNEAMQYIESLGKFGIHLGMERITGLVELLDHPERKIRTIHITGTNGKGSVASYLSHILTASGKKTACYTSPHFVKYNERMSIDGVDISDEDFAAVTEETKAAVDTFLKNGGEQPTQFEVITAMAFLYFAKEKVDYAVIEVGMGGLWDSTNVIVPELSVITNVTLEHTDRLGKTIEAIAEQKAGIIKAREHDADDVIAPGENIAIVAEQDPEAMRVILQRTVDVGAGVARAGSEFAALESRIAVGGQQLTIQGLGGMYEDIFLPLHGEHQAKNAAVALAAVEAFFGASAGNQLDIASVRTGFAKAISPGRLERVRTSPTTFLDACHNPHGAKALAAALDRDFDFARLIGVVSIFTDKDAAGILTALEAVLTEVVITQNTSPRARDAYELAELARDIFGEERVYVEPDLPSAYTQAVELAEDADVQSGSGIVITGSVVTAGDARALFGKEPA